MLEAPKPKPPMDGVGLSMLSMEDNTPKLNLLQRVWVQTGQCPQRNLYPILFAPYLEPSPPDHNPLGSSAPPNTLLLPNLPVSQVLLMPLDVPLIHRATLSRESKRYLHRGSAPLLRRPGSLAPLVHKLCSLTELNFK